MTSQTLRRKFLEYFQSKGHAILPSSPVIPHNDPTLLFTNAGMNQFKDVFLGKSKREYKRAVTTQKCIRVGGKHNDLENVGHTSRHLTFFEMLGNFSFGDYFKKEAIHFAWEVSLEIFELDPDRIWASVFETDEEAFALWQTYLPKERIVKFGEKENFWAMGDTGPCGPCSELLYDRGEGYGNAKSPLQDISGERYLEFWNLVFMESFRDETGSLHPLPNQSIDTGAGLERIVSLKLGVDNVFQTDILRSLIGQIEYLSQKKYDETDSFLAPAFHVIADHIRSLAFAIADGAQPSNVERGYVVRKILRRAVRYGRTLGFQQPFLAEILPHLVSLMGEDFPELKASQDYIATILTREEEAFLRTLQRGGNILQQVIERSREKREIGGDDAFKLKDTYGFPLEEIELIAKDENLSIDHSRFHKLEEEAREKSRSSHKKQVQQFSKNLFADFAKTHSTTFVGYERTHCDASLIGIVVKGQFVDEIRQGEEGMLLLDRSSFYAEKGGQVGDMGTIVHRGALFQVYDCISPYPGVVAHLGVMEQGNLAKGLSLKACVDEKRRQFIQNNHTATHLLHWALQKILGSHIQQAGSLVAPDRLRFDFNHLQALSSLEKRQIEDLVNEKIRTNALVEIHEMSHAEAQTRKDILQFFGEKYGELVRVVDIGFSKELCGGTHVSQLGSIGYFKIAKESSIAAGVRRIEAVTGWHAEQFVEEAEDRFARVEHLLQAPSEKAIEKLELVLQENKEISHQIKAIRKEQLQALASATLIQREQVGTVSLIATQVALQPSELMPFAEELLRQMHSGVVAIGTTKDRHCQLAVQISADLLQSDVNAKELIQKAAPFIEGKGGGKHQFAQAGGKKPEGMDSALSKIKELLKGLFP